MTPNRKQRPAFASIERIDILTPERTLLANGIPLNILRAGSEDVIRMDILIGSGIWHQEKPLQALFTNRMLCEGTLQKNSAQISELFDFYGAWMEQTSSMNYNFLTLYSLGKHFEHTVALLGEILISPSFPEHELQIVLNNNRQQYLVNSAKVNIMARKEFNHTYFGNGHPCGRHAQLEDYDRLMREDLCHFYRRHYHAGNCSIYLSGNITPSVIKAVERELGYAPWGEIKQRQPLPPYEIPTFESRQIHIPHKEAIQSAIRLGFPMMERTHPDYQEARILTTVLGGYFGSRLMNNIRKEKGYTYNVVANLASYPYTGLLTISTEADNEYAANCIKEIHHEMRRLQEELIPEQELSMVRNYMIGDMCRSHEGPFSLSDTWIFIETAGVKNTFIQDMARCIRETTPERLRTLADKYFRPNEALEIIVGGKENV